MRALDRRPKMYRVLPIAVPSQRSYPHSMPLKCRLSVCTDTLSHVLLLGAIIKDKEMRVS